MASWFPYKIFPYQEGRKEEFVELKGAQFRQSVTVMPIFKM